MESDSSDNEIIEMSLHSIKSDAEKDWIQTILINNQAINFKLDTGAQCDVIAENVAKKLNLKIIPSKTKYIVSYNNTKSEIVGDATALVKVASSNKQDKLTFKIVKFNAMSILGKKSCVKLGLVKRINTVDLDDDIFEGLGCLKDFKYKLEFTPNPEFQIRPSRIIPHVMRDEIKEEIKKMVKMQVIKKVEAPTPVVSNMVIARRNGKLRICIDPTDVNKVVLRRHYPLKTIEEIAARIKDSTKFTILDCKKGFWQIQIDEESQKYLTFSTP
jgi:hypothetical protein